MELFDDQKQCKREIYHNWNNGIIRQILGAPTGAGKTIMAMDIIRDAVSRGKKPMFMVDRISLAHQALNTFDAFGLNVSLYQGANTQIHWNENCIVASIHTLKTRRIPLCDLIMIDEVHINHKHYRKILDTYDNVKTLGLSATPLSPWLGEYFERIVKAPSMGELIELGRLVPFKIYSISEPDLKKIKITAGDYNEKQLAELMGGQLHIADVVKSWIKYGENRQTIAFAVDINHAKVMADDFRRNGITAHHIDCHMDDQEVKEIMQGHESGIYKILISVGKLTTGYDSPKTSCIILDRPTKSLMLHIQQCGRGPRKYEDKENVIVLDHTLNCINLGHPANFEIPDLINGEIKEVQAKKKTYKCKACLFVSNEKFDICPNCGKEKLIPSEDYRKELEYDRIDAPLAELKAKKKNNREYTNEQKSEWFSGLKYYSNQKGYKSGWAAYKYKEKFGVWPNHYKDVPAKPPTEEVLKYIKYLNIKAAKSRNKNVKQENRADASTNSLG